MSTREKCDYFLDSMPEYQLELVLAYIQGMKAFEEAADDAYCEALHQKYMNDPDRGEYVSEEALCHELGITL